MSTLLSSRVHRWAKQICLHYSIIADDATSIHPVSFEQQHTEIDLLAEVPDSESDDDFDNVSISSDEEAEKAEVLSQRQTECKPETEVSMQPQCKPFDYDSIL